MLEKATEGHKVNFQINLKKDLMSMKIPECIEHCQDVHCVDNDHNNDSDTFLMEIIQAIKTTADNCIPFSGQKQNKNKHQFLIGMKTYNHIEKKQCFGTQFGNLPGAQLILSFTEL